MLLGEQLEIYIQNLIEYCDKIKYSRAVVKAYIKYNVTDGFTQIHEKDFVVRHVVMPSRNGIYMGISISNSIRNNILYKLDLMQTNTLIDDYLHTQLAIVFVKLDKHNAHILNILNNLIKVCYK